MKALMLAAALIATGAAARERDSSDWHKVATAADRDRLKQWRDAWTAGLAAAAARPEVKRDADLFDPDRALPEPLPPPGAYRCRVFKLARRDGGAGPPFVAAAPSQCQVDTDGELANVLRFTKLDGSQRSRGRIYASDNARAVFLGTLVLGDETRKIPYGRDTARDMAGFVERIGPRRWRIVLPYPAFESKLDVIELVPAG